MTNATTNSNSPAGPYAVIVLTGGFTVERFAYPDPTGALISAMRYLREGRQVRLADRTCAALKEVPELYRLDALIEQVSGPPPAPETPGPVLVFKAGDDRG